MAKKTSIPPHCIEQIFYGMIDEDQVAIYRTRIGGEWVYNLTAKDLRTYNTSTKNYQVFERIFSDLASYKRIQTSETWFNRFDDLLDELRDRHWPLVYEIYIHPDFRDTFAQDVEIALNAIRSTWNRVCYPDQKS